MAYSIAGVEWKRSWIGQNAANLPTPALLLHLDRAQRNIALMAELMKPYRCALRPHIKCHKSPQLAKLQLGAGAQGVTVATLWEAQAMTDEGIADILIANQIVGAAKLSVLAETALRLKLLWLRMIFIT